MCDPFNDNLYEICPKFVPMKGPLERNSKLREPDAAAAAAMANWQSEYFLLHWLQSCDFLIFVLESVTNVLLYNQCANETASSVICSGSATA